MKEFRRVRNFTQEKLAESTGLTTTHIGHIETGRRWPGPEVIESIASSLGVPSSALFTMDIVKIEPTPQEALEVLAKAIQAPKPQLPAAVVDVLSGAGEWNQDKIDALSALVMGFQVAANSPNQRKDAHKSRA